jgi:hypothetical protein
VREVEALFGGKGELLREGGTPVTGGQKRWSAKEFVMHGAHFVERVSAPHS